MLISCVMPTRGRPEYAKRAVEQFLAQTWPDTELLIADDFDCPSFPNPASFRHFEDRRVKFWVLDQRPTIGAKRNFLCGMAAGELIAHWDDDDSYAPRRLEDQAERLLSSGKIITGYNVVTFRDAPAGELWQYNGVEDYPLGASLMYRKEYWQQHPFEDLGIDDQGNMRGGEDTFFIRFARAKKQVICADARDLLIASIHPGNTCKRQTAASPWKRIDAA